MHCSGARAVVLQKSVQKRPIYTVDKDATVLHRVDAAPAHLLTEAPHVWRLHLASADLAEADIEPEANRGFHRGHRRRWDHSLDRP